MQRLDKLNLAQKHWTRNPKESRKPKEVKFAVEAIEMDETVKNRFKNARIARAKNKLKDARIAKIKNESQVEKITMDPYYGLISAKLQKLLEVWKMNNCGTRRDH